jgi:hypothetical protein
MSVEFLIHDEKIYEEYHGIEVCLNDLSENQKNTKKITDEILVIDSLLIQY